MIPGIFDDFGHFLVFWYFFGNRSSILAPDFSSVLVVCANMRIFATNLVRYFGRLLAFEFFSINI